MVIILFFPPNNHDNIQFYNNIISFTTILSSPSRQWMLNLTIYLMLTHQVLIWAGHILHINITPCLSYTTSSVCEVFATQCTCALRSTAVDGFGKWLRPWPVKSSIGVCTSDPLQTHAWCCLLHITEVHNKTANILQPPINMINLFALC